MGQGLVAVRQLSPTCGFTMFLALATGYDVHVHSLSCLAKAANVGLVAIMEKASAGEWSFYKEAGHTARCDTLSPDAS